MSEIVVTLPLPPNMTNDGRVHWSQKQRAHARYFQSCDNQRICAKPLGLRFDEPHHADTMVYPVDLHYALTLGAHMDDDNALARCKWGTDWLVSRGYLLGDSHRYAKMHIPTQKVTRNARVYCLEITIVYEPVEDATLASLTDYGAHEP